jgi:hypothetical protein
VPALRFLPRELATRRGSPRESVGKLRLIQRITYKVNKNYQRINVFFRFDKSIPRQEHPLLP